MKKLLGLEDDPFILGFCNFSGVNSLLILSLGGGYWGKSFGNENPIIEQWPKPWLVGLYRGLYYPIIWKSQYKDPYKPMRISWNVISGFWTVFSNFKHIFLKERSLVDCPLHRQKWFVHVVIRSLSNLVGDFLWIRTHGIHHHFSPPYWECLHIFFPTTKQANPRISSLFWIRTLSETNSSHLKHCWKISFLWGRPFLKGEMWVSGRVFFFPLTRKLATLWNLKFVLDPGFVGATSSNQHDLKITDRRLTKSISKGFIGGK